MLKVNLPKTYRLLEEFKKRWKRLAVQALAKDGKNASGSLSRGINPTIFREGSKFGVAMDFPSAVDYWDFVDQGVQGKKDTSKAPDSPYRFGSGTGKPGGLRSSIDKWVIRKGLDNVRNAKGQFISRKSMVSAISRKIYLYGIKPTPFLSDTLEDLFKRYFTRIEAAIVDDIRDSMQDAQRDEGLYFSVTYTM